jgi:hypothetical protein
VQFLFELSYESGDLLFDDRFGFCEQKFFVSGEGSLAILDALGDYGGV